MFHSVIIALVSSLIAVAAQSSARASGTAAPTASVSAAAAQATLPITIQGNAFFRGSDRFYIRGVDYQPGGSSSLTDPLAVEANCARDIPYMQQLGINTIRVYQVDNSANHDACMTLLQRAGIYLILDVNTAKFAISRSNAAGSYNSIYLQHIFAAVDAFKAYPNTLGFFGGNEVINDDVTVNTAPWVKATVRDLKQYVAAQSKRFIPVGYSAADVAGNRVELAQYFNCGDNATRADFYGFNSYSWCGASSFTQSGFVDRVSEFSNYSIPLFFSEFGCNLVQPRPFTEIESIYSTQMTGVFSGGLVYEWSQEENNYGLVKITGNSVSLLQDYNNLASEYKKTPNPSGSGGFKSGAAPAICPSNSSTFQGVWAQNVLPAQPSGAAAYIRSGAGAALGDNGPSNIDAGGAAGVSAGAATASGPTASASGSVSRTSASASATAKSSGIKMVMGDLSLVGLLAFLGLGAWGFFV